jgi:hypothetical protein
MATDTGSAPMCVGSGSTVVDVDKAATTKRLKKSPSAIRSAAIVPIAAEPDSTPFCRTSVGLTNSPVRKGNKLKAPKPSNDAINTRRRSTG